MFFRKKHHWIAQFTNVVTYDAYEYYRTETMHHHLDIQPVVGYSILDWKIAAIEFRASYQGLKNVFVCICKSNPATLDSESQRQIANDPLWEKNLWIGYFPYYLENRYAGLKRQGWLTSRPRTWNTLANIHINDGWHLLRKRQEGGYEVVCATDGSNGKIYKKLPSWLVDWHYIDTR